ncbi:MAG: DUF547 domain-containing protein [Desulfobulbaceae bacterium]|nr:DUF547 domain-containing protein [Desulfobulbaceae bacterium]
MVNSIHSTNSLLKPWLFFVVFTAATFCLSTVAAAPSPNLWPRWQTNLPDSKIAIDHRIWDGILKNYLVTNHPSAINRFRYSAVSPADREALAAYIKKIQRVEVSALKPMEQRSYWINLYNALTVQVILDHYPVKSIMDIDISPGLFSNGPWDAKLLTIEGEKVSLNDIEHRILRPIFNDNRLHYALNCASLGCPNLQPVAFTAANSEELLENSARAYINSSRGARMVKGRLYVSSIYKWFQVDFGGSEAGVVKHLQEYAEDGLADSLRTYNKGFRDDYDWSLNSSE